MYRQTVITVKGIVFGNDQSQEVLNQPINLDAALEDRSSFARGKRSVLLTASVTIVKLHTK